VTIQISLCTETLGASFPTASGDETSEDFERCPSGYFCHDIFCFTRIFSEETYFLDKYLGIIKPALKSSHCNHPRSRLPLKAKLEGLEIKIRLSHPTRMGNFTRSTNESHVLLNMQYCFILLVIFNRDIPYSNFHRAYPGESFVQPCRT
jgi:hypothetical protein